MKKAAIRNPHIQWFHIDFRPSSDNRATLHIVPVMAKVASQRKKKQSEHAELERQLKEYRKYSARQARKAAAKAKAQKAVRKQKRKQKRKKS